MTGVIDQRREFSLGRINGLGEALANLNSTNGSESICIYVTGSYARGEASEHSDLDIFLVREGSKQENQIGRIPEVKIVSSLIDAQNKSGFPDFSDDGEYLKFHYIDDILRNLGNPHDDYTNAFTARLLLLLESRPVFGEKIYRGFVDGVVNAYFVDFHDHEKNFRPIFLVNDILRFWRTLCLNYENKRSWRQADPQARAKGHLQNLKLKFSRLLTCFSAVAILACQEDGLTHNKAKNLLTLTPVERVLSVAKAHGEVSGYLSEFLECYEWFLDKMAAPKDEVLDWILKEDERDIAFNRARAFGKVMYHITFEAAKKAQNERFLVI